MARHLGQPRPVVGRTLRDRIADGRWPVGHRLPTERELAAEFGLARNTLRKVLDELEAEGQLERQVGRGTFVRARPDGDRQQADPWGVALPGGLPRRTGPDADSLARLIAASSPAEVMEARLVIEPHVAALAAQRAGAEDLAAIGAALNESLRARGVGAFEHWDGELHLAIFRAARNALLASVCVALNGVRTQARWHRIKERTVTDERRALYDRQHADVAHAIRDRDADAARRLLHGHLTTVRDALLGIGDG